MTRDARLIGTLELIRSACDVLAVGHHFVVASWAILFAIANPAAMNARYLVIAEIFGIHAGRLFQLTSWNYLGAVL